VEAADAPLAADLAVLQRLCQAHPARPPVPAVIAALQRTIGNRATGRLLARQHAELASGDGTQIQRQIQWVDGARARDINLTKPLTEFMDFGITPAKINAEEFPGGDAASAISPPVLSVNRAMLGLSSATVLSEPFNVVGYRMRLPQAPPWQETVDTEMVLSALKGHAPQAAEAGLEQYGRNVQGQTLLKVKGLPSDAEFANLVEEHENHHVEEIRDGVRGILRPWDAKITKFIQQHESFTRMNPESAKEALFKNAGGNPVEIGQRMVDYFKGRGEAFHRTHAGSSPTIAQVDIDEANSTLTMHWKHPLSH
jgi:hypothetical protein